MLVTDIAVRNRGEVCELIANVRFDAHWVWGDEPFRLWYRFPPDWEPFLSCENGDPFVAAFLVPAMTLGESLHVDGSVSSKLLRATSEIQSIYRSFRNDLPYVQIDSNVREDSSASNDSERHIGLFFSLGVDSCYSLLKNCQQAAFGTITHLINVLGFDIYLWEARRYPAVLESINRVAEHFDKRVLPVSTNLREVTDRVADWLNLYHSAALASVGLSLGAAFESIFIAASTTYNLLGPLGSHPSLDPLWSTKSLSFVHDGCESGRIDKIRFISRSPALLGNLRVCAADDMTGVYNCGRCWKCLKTMVGLHIAGSLRRCETLPDDIDLPLLRGVELKSVLEARAAERHIAALGSSGTDLAIKTALSHCIAKSGLLPRSCQQPVRQVTP